MIEAAAVCLLRCFAAADVGGRCAAAAQQAACAGRGLARPTPTKTQNEQVSRIAL